MNISYPLEVVGRGSETQLQVGENVNLIMLRLKRQGGDRVNDDLDKPTPTESHQK